MLSSLEMVSEPSGKTKTLADMIKDGSILTPDTPVHTSDDSIELKDYIESLIPEPPAPGAGPWEKLCEFTASNNTAAAWPDEMQDFFNDPQYNEIMIFISKSIATGADPKDICTSLVLPAAVITGDNTVKNVINLAMGNATTDSYQYGITFTTVKDGDIYKFTPFWNYTPAFSNGLKVTIYVR